MKKITKLLSIPLLVCTFSAYADTIPIQVLMKCDDGLKPVAHRQFVSVTSTTSKSSREEFQTTDSNGYIYINSISYKKGIQVFEAYQGTIDIDCHSPLTPVRNGSVILPENGSTCPVNYCK